MGGGSWSTRAYTTYACSVGHGYDSNTCTLKASYTSASQAFTAHGVDSKMDPKNVIRECCDSDDHTNMVHAQWLLYLPQ